VTVPLAHTPWWQLWRPTRTLDATEWLLELLTKANTADQRKVFPILEPTLRGTLGLKDASGSGPTYFAFTQLEPRLEEIAKQTLRISKITPITRTAWERECLKLRNALIIYERLKNSLQPNSFLQHEAGGKPIAYDFDTLLTQYRIDLRAGVEAAVARKQGKQQELDTSIEERMRTFARPYAAVSRAGLLAIVPPADPATSRDRWQNIGTVLVDSARTGQVPVPTAHFAAMSSAFAQGKPPEFNREVTKYRQWLRARGLEPEASKARFEFFSNRFQPFVRATAVYLVIVILGCASWMKRSTVLYRSAALLVVLACVLHTAGLLFEMMLEGRPPVTNVYSSLIFAGWVAVLVGMAVERRHRNGIGMVVAALAGLVTLTVAHGLAPGGAMALMRAVLDINFWLAIAAIAIALTARKMRGAPRRRLLRGLAPRPAH
jgi:hypothetical protein